ncbi:MAG: AMP-dependent synthetase/ligase [Acidimicrobiales bacterium]
MGKQATKEEIDAAVEGQTVPAQFLKTVAAHPDRVALRWKEGDDWASWTFGEYADLVARATTGLSHVGVGPGDRVVLMMRNRPEFHVLDMAVLMRGATPISIYNSSSADQVAYLAGHSEASVAIVEDAGFLERFTKVRDKLPGLRTTVVLDEASACDADGSYARLIDHEPADLDTSAATVKPDDLVTVIYTSGTTGPPKGVRLSHYNICWTAESYMRLIDRDPVGLRTISYLPMAHVAERVATHYLGALFAEEVTTCPDPTQVAAYAREIHPQALFGVPRVWEKIYAGVNAALAADPEKSQKFGEAIDAAKPLALAKAMRELTAEEEATLAFLDEVAFAPVRALIGLDACEVAVSGAAPIPVEILEWFRAIGVPMSEIYGMSENSGPLTWDPYEIKPGTVGRQIPGCTVQLAEDGEIVAKGGNVFDGYLGDPEKTADALDDEGWLHTGDIGEIDDEGYVRIVDRKKELIITAGGKNVSPANLEANLKMIPLVGQACAIGDQRPFVSALVVLDPEIAPAWARSQGIEFDSIADLAANPAVKDEVERGVADVMSVFSNAEQVKKVTILSDEWLPDSEELTPTSKLKRRGVHAKYAEEIEALYR